MFANYGSLSFTFFRSKYIMVFTVQDLSTWNALQNISSIKIRTRLSLPKPENPKSFSNFLRPEPEWNSVFMDWQNLNKKKSRKKIHKKFRKQKWILVLFWSKISLKPVNPKTQEVFGQFSQTRKILNWIKLY